MLLTKQSSTSYFISICAATHFVVDASCAFLFLNSVAFNDNIILCMLLYNALAFAFQAPFGYLIDRGVNPQLAALMGVLILILSFCFLPSTYVLLTAIGVGNALFHVGTGSLVLSLPQNKATYSGVYVSTGSIGLAVGTFCALSDIDYCRYAFGLMLTILALLMFWVNTPIFIRQKSRMAITKGYLLIILLLTLPIVVRSLIGLAIEFPWKEQRTLYCLLILALALGKIVGGILADKFNLIAVGVGALLVSSLLLGLFPSVPLLAILGAFIFNFTMPVTLIAVFNAMPSYKGLAFGITTLALFVGSLPVILGADQWVNNKPIILLLILIAAIVLYIALKKEHQILKKH